jgi:PPK2 family polyphosphate:nucleotide phosphotransferase
MASFRVRPGSRVRLDRCDPGDTSAFDGSKARALAATRRQVARLDHLQELLYANRSWSLLVVLQALDTGGKDGTIRRVFDGVNPQGVRVAAFKVPTAVEKDHDFLWRVHARTPAKGEIVIFNRSHYEDVLVARVDRLVPKRVWKARFRAINGFERTLTEEGTTVLKFFLHISEAEQRRRLAARLADPTKHWKFSAGDTVEPTRYAKYTAAIEDVLEKTSTPWAPWHLIPADAKWFRDWAVSKILVAALDGLHLTWPPLPKEFGSIRIER